MRQIRRRALLCAAGCAAALAAAPAKTIAGDATLASLRALLQQSWTGIDYGFAKLTIDKLVDPSCDCEAASAHIERLLAAAQRLVAIGPVAVPLYAQKIDALRTVIYSPGAWNGQRPFVCGENGEAMGGSSIAASLLPHYLHARAGNCVSMPALFLALAQRMGLVAHLSNAPDHFFVKTRAPGGILVNHECTQDARPKADASYAREYEISSLAMRCKTYLHPLTPRQAVVAMARTLVASQATAGDAVAAHATADLLLEAEPGFFEAMFCKMLAYQASLRPFVQRYPNLGDLPLEVRSKVYAVKAKLDEWEAKIRALGWKPRR